MRRVVVVALLAATPTYADPDEEAVQDLDLTPKPIVVHGTLDHATAQLTARFVLDVHGPGVAQEEPTITIPEHSMVTGAVATVDGAVHRLPLLSAERAGNAFEAITNAPGGASRRWAVHVAMDALRSTGITVQLAAPHDARLTLDLEIAAPTCFYKDVRYVAVPARWTDALDRGLRSSTHVTEDELLAECGVDPATGMSSVDELTWIAFPTGELSSRPFGDQRIDGIASRLPLSTEHLARVELDLAREISKVPADLHTAIVIDASRSVTAEERDAQRAIIAAYLRAAPTSFVQVIAYDRRSHPLLPAWTPAAQAAARVDRELRALTGRNGSNVDVGLGEAATWLARIAGTRRILLFTDERLADRLADAKPVALRRFLSSDTLVHVVALAGDRGLLERDDDALLGPLAMATEGIAVRGRVEDDGTVDATMLARPITLESIEIAAPGWTTVEPTGDGCVIDGALHEGSACVWWGQGGAAAGPVTIEGLLWNRRFVRVLRPDPSQARTLARILAVTSFLDEDLQKEVERAAVAVDAAWSLFASWGGHDGYGDLLHDELFGGGRFGCTCGGVGTTGGFGSGSGGLAPLLDLKTQLEPQIERCRPGAARFGVDIETTFEEIVDVEVTVDGTRAADGALRDCITDAVWDTLLAIPNAPAHVTTSVAFGA